VEASLSYLDQYRLPVWGAILEPNAVVLGEDEPFTAFIGRDESFSEDDHCLAEHLRKLHILEWEGHLIEVEGVKSA
jgi:hypothetical protein